MYISNTRDTEFDVIELTNEMPFNRLGGVGSVIENLMSGFEAKQIKVLWFLVDHHYSESELKIILKLYSNIAIGSYKDIGRFKSGIVHLHAYNHNSELFSYIKNYYKIFTIHSLQICEAISNDVDLSWAIERQEKFILQVDKIILVSKSEMKKYYQHGYNKLNSNVDVVYNGLKVPKKKEFCKKNHRIGYSGRLVPRKHPEYCQMILKEKGFEKYETYIAGRGFSKFASLLALDKQIGYKIHYLGWCGGERLEQFYSSIDVLTIPSIYEPFGMSALEAVIRKIPVVCTKLDGLVEVLGDNAFYCSDVTYNSFKNAMVQWLNSDPVVLRRKALNAFEYYMAHYTDIKMVENYVGYFT